MFTVKKILSISLGIVLLLTNLLYVKAEEDFSNTSYWNQLCTNTTTLNEEEKASCQAYMEYMQKQNTQLQQQISDIDSKKSEISENIASYAAKITSYDTTIQSLNEMMVDLNIQIEAAEKQLAEMKRTYDKNKANIAIKEDEIAQLEERVKERMVEQQKNMHFNPYIDLLVGAKTFSDMIRIVDGMNAISEADAAMHLELKDGIAELQKLNEDLLVERQAVEKLEGELMNGKKTLEAQQTTLLSSKYEAELIRQTYTEQYNEVLDDAKVAELTIEANKELIGNVDESIQNSKATPTPAPTTETTPEQPQQEPTSQEVASATEEPAHSTDLVVSGDENAQVGDSSENPYYGGWSNCTWGAWQLVHDTLGISLPGWGWSTNWINDASASGYPTGSEPQVNSIAVYENHVAFVTAVDGDQVYIKEGNYLGAYGERWVSKYELPWTGQRCLGYIYL